jgi:two-component system chemotaxis response regulator CheB
MMRVLVVDDSTLFRKVVRDTLAAIPGVEIAGVAADGEAALEKIRQLHPDAVTLDIEMPRKSGLDVLRDLPSAGSKPAVIMLSAMTDEGASATTQALRLGAFDFVLKPKGDSYETSCAQLRRDLLPKIESLMQRTASPSVSPTPSPARPVAATGERGSVALSSSSPVQIVGIGVSTGGPVALGKLLPALPADLPCPIVIVQHMPPLFTSSLARDLDRNCRISVSEASDGTRLVPGHAYIAPGGKQMKVVDSSGLKYASVTDDPPERNCKPAVDYLFRSLSQVYGAEALGVVLTGMGDDGTLGCRLMKRRGSRILVEDQSTCVVYGMPRSVSEAGLADVAAPLEQIGGLITQAAKRGAAVCR